MRSPAVEYPRAMCSCIPVAESRCVLTAVLERGLFWFASALLIFLVMVLFASGFLSICARATTGME